MSLTGAANFTMLQSRPVSTPAASTLDDYLIATRHIRMLLLACLMVLTMGGTQAYANHAFVSLVGGDISHGAGDPIINRQTSGDLGAVDSGGFVSTFPGGSSGSAHASVRSIGSPGGRLELGVSTQINLTTGDGLGGAIFWNSPGGNFSGQGPTASWSDNLRIDGGTGPTPHFADIEIRVYGELSVAAVGDATGHNLISVFGSSAFASKLGQVIDSQRGDGQQSGVSYGGDWQMIDVAPLGGANNDIRMTGTLSLRVPLTGNGAGDFQFTLENQVYTESGTFYPQPDSVTTLTNFYDTLTLSAIKLPEFNNATPESLGYSVRFASGIASPNAVPEPSSILILTSGLVSLAGWSMQRRRQAA